MSKKGSRNTRAKIVSAAWKLFYDQGYDETTIDEIVEASATSKGSFYHYFECKDDLLGSLAYLFDEKYDQIGPELEDIDSCFDKLLYMTNQLFIMIEDTVSVDLLSGLLSTQLTTRGEKHLLDRNRTYFKLLRGICMEGQEKGEFNSDMTVNDMIKLYALAERALMYDWCLCNGEYSLRSYATEVMPSFISKFKKA